MQNFVSYVRVPQDDPADPNESKNMSSPTFISKIIPCLALLCVAGTLLSTALSITFFVKSTMVSSSTVTLASTSGMSLRRPNPYINLDKVKLFDNSSQITNFPEMVLRIDLNDSLRTMKEDYRMLHTHSGVVFTDERHIQINSQVSSIIQFRHLDYALETCSLRAQLPEYNERKSIGSGSIIDVWLLEASREISREIYDSKKSAPNRRLLLASWALSENSDIVYEFNCPSGEFTTLELSCPGSPEIHCDVDFWQDKRRTPTAEGQINPEITYSSRSHPRCEINQNAIRAGTSEAFQNSIHLPIPRELRIELANSWTFTVS